MSKVLLIGASSALGREIGAKLESNGHTVVGTFNSQKIRDNLVAMDVRSEESIKSVVTDAIEQMEGIDATIYCSAIDYPELTIAAKIDKWQEVMDVNYFGAVRVVKYVLPHYLHNGGGIFEFISSGMATRSNIGTVSYAASKAALNALSLGISKEFGGKGVISFTVMPGFFDGGLIKDMDARKKARISTLIDSKRIAQPDEIAAFCVASMENSSYLSSSNLEINGGLA